MSIEFDDRELCMFTSELLLTCNIYCKEGTFLVLSPRLLPSFLLRFTRLEVQPATTSKTWCDSGWALLSLTAKTVGFLSKRVFFRYKSATLTRLICFHPHSYTFLWPLPCSWPIQKYDLFCSLFFLCFPQEDSERLFSQGAKKRLFASSTWSWHGYFFWQKQESLPL